MQPSSLSKYIIKVEDRSKTLFLNKIIGYVSFARQLLPSLKAIRFMPHSIDTLQIKKF